jgi:hypothetical protein
MNLQLAYFNKQSLNLGRLIGNGKNREQMNKKKRRFLSKYK